jgi:A/G-specific adenine glycosylase
MSALFSEQFQTIVYEYYDKSGRHDLVWRKADADGSYDPYKILVSEIMLQQTQVPRVVPKYEEFIAHFPNIVSLADAPLGDVLRLWNGLGYNRRAQYLHRSAQEIIKTMAGRFPRTTAELITLPGIGNNTAGAILAYSFNQPIIFIETNIRTVFIHHFFQGVDQVSDADILKLVEEMIDRDNPRQWYWALMDYGSHLKHSVGNPNTASKLYVKQSKFQGSRRQLRGQIIRQLKTQSLSLEELQAHIIDDRLGAVISQLVAEQLIKQVGDRFSL